MKNINIYHMIFNTYYMSYNRIAIGRYIATLRKKFKL